jgi:hypothetical protein
LDCATLDFASHFPAWSVPFSSVCQIILTEFCHKFDARYLPLVPFLHEGTREFAARTNPPQKKEKGGMANKNSEEQRNLAVGAFKPLIFAAKSKQYTCAMQVCV